MRVPVAELPDATGNVPPTMPVVVTPVVVVPVVTAVVVVVTPVVVSATIVVPVAVAGTTVVVVAIVATGAVVMAGGGRIGATGGNRECHNSGSNSGNITRTHENTLL